MKKHTLLIFLFAIAALIIPALLFLNINQISSELKQSKTMLAKAQDDLKQAEENRERLVQENEKLKADAVSYVSLNTKLQKESEMIEANFEEAKKRARQKEEDYNTLRKKLEGLSKALADKSNKLEQQKELAKEMEDLKKEMDLLNSQITQERALYHYNLGVAYSQAKFYNEAIGEYEKSLDSNPDNPDAHYNLGLLYDNIKKEREKAVEHFSKYLELKPAAPDKQEVESWIKRLKLKDY